ncbi:MAG: aminomethyl-transferring glycine dehydrogenase, partial [Thermoproteota archaeon]
MTMNKHHPYIPNSEEEVEASLLRSLGLTDIEELFMDVPRSVRLDRPLKIPESSSELEVERRIEEILKENLSIKDLPVFLGGGFWPHYVPAAVEEIVNRSEFLTSYTPYQPEISQGVLQALFEFQSMIGELVGFDVVGVPTYDWGASAGNAIRMASRITGRREVLLPKIISPSRLSIIMNFCQPKIMPNHIDVKTVNYDKENGMLDLEDLKEQISSKTAAVYFENPSYLGIIEAQGKEISDIAHDKGAESIVGVDPISLGVLAPPSEYGADIACGEVQPLGIHMYCGGSLSGFIATRDDEKYVGE